VKPCSPFPGREGKRHSSASAPRRGLSSSTSSWDAVLWPSASSQNLTPSSLLPANPLCPWGQQPQLGFSPSARALFLHQLVGCCAAALSFLTEPHPLCAAACKPPVPLGPAATAPGVPALPGAHPAASLLLIPAIPATGERCPLSPHLPPPQQNLPALTDRLAVPGRDALRTHWCVVFLLGPLSKTEPQQ